MKKQIQLVYPNGIPSVIDAYLPTRTLGLNYLS
jgi:hypothetical protein